MDVGEKFMRKVKAIIKYEFLNLRKNFIIIIMMLLSLFGLHQHEGKW